jgi:polyhydroxyalkanoate synthesis regulator phasin
MLTQIKKGLLASLGGVIITREKAEKIIQRLVEDAKISEEEGRRLMEELIDAGEKQRTNFESAVRKTLRNSLEKLDLCSGEAFRTLKDRVENLEKRAQILEEAVQRLDRT